MSALLEAIQAERRALIEPLLASVADKLRVLDEMEQLAARLNGGGSDVPAIEAPAPPAPVEQASSPAREQRALPAKTPSTGVERAPARGGLPPKTQAALDALRAVDGWASIGELARTLETTPAALKRHIQALVARRLAEAKGQTAARRYRATEQRALTPAAALPPPPAPPASVSVTSDEVAKPEQVAKPRPPAPPRPAPRPSAVPDLTIGERRIVRARILDHCDRRRLDEQSLATLLNVHREHVADICGSLLLEDKLEMLPDGRYMVPE